MKNIIHTLLWWFLERFLVQPGKGSINSTMHSNWFWYENMPTAMCCCFFWLTFTCFLQSFGITLTTCKQSTSPISVPQFWTSVLVKGTAEGTFGCSWFWPENMHADVCLWMTYFHMCFLCCIFLHPINKVLTKHLPLSGVTLLSGTWLVVAVWSCPALAAAPSSTSSAAP